MKEDLEYVIELGITHITYCAHLVQIAHELGSWEQYHSLIRVGTRAQELLAAELGVQEKRESLEQKRAELAARQISTTGIDKNLQDVIDQIEKLGPSAGFSSSQLRAWILETANKLIDAARLESREDVVLLQSILVFKMTLTLPKFEEVHTLCPAKDWPTVKKDLLNYLVNHDSTLPGSPITLKMQIELLLSQGMWKEAIQILPDPEANNSEFNTQGLEILELIWLEIDNRDSSKLDQLLPLIEKYARKEYQVFKFQALDRLLDLVQVHFADFIIELHKIGSDIVSSNMQAKQYDDYCEFLLRLRSRLQGLGMQKDWDAFIQGVRKDNARKKKLITIMNAHEL
eukprot:c7596_g1_i1.p1 GENE.c7596_g1_i1~~c7596_g1_i1.p1  ORF type:complete len:376 (-),score=114.88 c7596_g1_i1:44-1072(-)